MPKPSCRKLTAAGVACGIGSMLVGAEQAGFSILGNIEWRKWAMAKDRAGNNTFTRNFPGSFFSPSLETKFQCDLVLGHPSCGMYSGLPNRTPGKDKKTQGDIAPFIAILKELRPRFFALDNLAKSLEAVPLFSYAEALPEYDIFPELVSNWAYGNAQKFRNRMFIIGALKSERFMFIPSENSRGNDLRDLIGDLLGKNGSTIPNHEPFAWEEKARRGYRARFLSDRPTWKELAEYARLTWSPGSAMTYYSPKGGIKPKPGCRVERWEGPLSVLDKGSYKLHPIEFRDLTIRERARIQGLPDDFVFYPANLNEGGEYNPDHNMVTVHQTGRCIPIQFCHYLSGQIADHILERKSLASGKRVLPPNPLIDQAKLWYCLHVGYSDQARACQVCWLRNKCEVHPKI